MNNKTYAQQLHSSWRKAVNAFNALSSNERRLIIVTAVVALLILGTYPIEAVNNYLDETKRLAVIRQRDYDDIVDNVKRFRSQQAKLKTLKDSFREQKLTFEQLTSQLDETIRAATGGAKYNIRKSGDPKPLGEEFQAQNRTLSVRSLTLQQLVKLLYQLEQGKTPLFLGSVDVLRGQRDGDFNATLEITTIGAKRAG